MLRKKSLEEGTSVKSLLVVELESNKRMWWQVEKLADMDMAELYCYT